MSTNEQKDNPTKSFTNYWTILIFVIDDFLKRAFNDVDTMTTLPSLSYKRTHNWTKWGALALEAGKDDLPGLLKIEKQPNMAGVLER